MGAQTVGSSRKLTAFVAVILIGLLGWMMRPVSSGVQAIEVHRGALRETVDEEGETRVRRRFVVAAPVAGRVQRIVLDEGDSVDLDAVVAHIDPRPLDPRVHAEMQARREAAEASRREADAHVEQARAAAAQAQRSAARSRKLKASGTVSSEELETAELEESNRKHELEAALFAASAAEHAVEAAQAALLAPGVSAPSGGASNTPALVEVRSPIRGQVLRVLEESERVVEAGAPLLEVGDPLSLEIVIDVLSTDAVRIRPEAPIEIVDWGGPQALHARVRHVEPSAFTKVSALGVEEQRVNVIADFVDPPAALGDRYRVEAQIVVWEKADVLKVPTSALFRRGGQWSVFLVENGRAAVRSLEIGHRSVLEAEVLTGLDEGALVISHPSDQVVAGARVHAL